MKHLCACLCECIWTCMYVSIVVQLQMIEENTCSRRDNSSDSNVVAIAIFAVVMVVSITCNIALGVWVFRLQKQKINFNLSQK